MTTNVKSLVYETHWRRDEKMEIVIVCYYPITAAIRIVKTGMAGCMAAAMVGFV